MARAKSNEQGRIKPKATALDEVNRGIETLTGLIAQIEDLSREGFPYRDAVRARTELSLRETIRRIFGDKSEEYQTYKTYKLRTGHRAESVQTIAILKQLVGQLEQQKFDLLGIKPASVEPSAVVRRAGETPSLPAAPIPSAAAAAAASESICRTTPSDDAAGPLAAVPAIASDSSPSIQPAGERRQVSSSPQAYRPEVPPAEPTSLLTDTALTDPAALDQSTVSPVRKPAVAPPPLSAADALSPAKGSGSAQRPTQSAVEPCTGPAVEHSPLPHLPSVTQAAEEHPASASLYTEDSRLTGWLSPAGTTAGVHQAGLADHSSVQLPKHTRSFSDPTFHPDDPIAALRKVCTRFHLVARQLRLRRDYRATLEVEDEYDVQDLLYALLRLEFEEVGSEDWCPGYGDGTTRTSYLLHKERVVIVAKKTKTGVTARELTEQVKIDSSHYSGRADCRTMVCFIYDPEGRIGNPRGLESDLTTVSDIFTLEVIIAPK